MMQNIRHWKWLAVAALFCSLAIAWSQDQIRVASYNIKFFSTGVTNQGTRLDKLKSVVQILDADVIGLQEIDDRAALELLFPTNAWEILIDDASDDDQDLALAARKSSVKVNSQKFLFPNAQDNQFFPDKRDVLCAELELANSTNSSATFYVLVHYAKSRYGGRATTDYRREGASVKLVDMLKQDFDDKDFILLGDFNDNPDDRSLNILETGDVNAQGGPEEIDGPLLINLMDQLCAEGHVSHGRSAVDIIGDRVNTIDPNSRQRNNNARGTDTNTGDILFDQILFPVSMANKYVQGSAKVFDNSVAIQGSGSNVASDHLPVYAEFVLAAEVEPGPTGIRIVSMLPNPEGQDAGKEEVTIGNFTASVVNLPGFKLVDKAGNEFGLSGTIPANGKLTIVMSSNSMPLNNASGDEVRLLDAGGNELHKVSYTGAQAKSGKTVSF